MATVRRPAPEQAPERLTRFCLMEWAGEAPGRAIDSWHECRLAWHREHCRTEDDGAEMSALGSALDLLRSRRAVRLFWARAEGLLIALDSVQLPCTISACDGITRCALRRVSP